MSLFSNSTNTPLAERLRPTKLEEVIGQEHLVGKEGLLRKLIENKQLTSIIFWGPPGSGKTTLARIIANKSKAKFVEISAVTSGIKEVKQIVSEAKKLRDLGESTILFVDEIHRFNKAQQDAFLPHVERGTITIIGATTENPSFEVIGPLISRSRVLVLNLLSVDDLVTLIDRAIKRLPGKSITVKAKQLLALMSAGDARVALNGLETAASLATSRIGVKHVESAMQQVSIKYDKNGEEHFNTVSAFIKSMRGGDVDATLLYLQRMLLFGEDPKFIARRMIVFASEDIGMAAPYALTLAVSAFQAVERVGLPEGEYALTHCAIALAESPKSRAVASALGKSRQAIKDNPSISVPLHLRNAPTKLMKQLGYNKDYQWQANFKPKQGFMPKGLEELKFYRPKKPRKA